MPRKSTAPPSLQPLPWSRQRPGPRASTKDVELEGPNAASPDSAERVFNEAVAVHDHHHHRRGHSKSKKLAKEGSGKRHSRKTKEGRQVDAATVATGGELPPTTRTVFNPEAALPVSRVPMWRRLRSRSRALRLRSRSRAIHYRPQLTSH
ncbi:hypothetical protein HPB50_000782 [Hyalomma asiaticum]|uniref:Uncharacterized protein n=1 Tax=Hyalomma asiaticum TaxID=266040 RepID=A0ACB7RLV1_HYAAI|nr:hypothetical protein HPB50_000782 [Hyalomma asiaticum]